MLKILKEGYTAVIDASRTLFVFVFGMLGFAFFVIAFVLGVVEIIKWMFL